MDVWPPPVVGGKDSACFSNKPYYYIKISRNVKSFSCFSEKDQELLLRFGEGFGASDAEGQISHCRLTMELLRRRLEEAGEEKKQKGRLYRMLGVLGSLGTALLLC